MKIVIAEKSRYTVEIIINHGRDNHADTALF